MATEYDFYGSADVSTDEIRDLVLGAVGGTVQPDGLVVTDGMSVNAFRVDSGDEMTATRRFGFEHTVTMIFRFYNNRPPEVTRQSMSLMVRAVLTCFDRLPGPGVLLYNGEEVTLQRLGGDVEFNSDWEVWSEIPDVAGIVARHVARPLAQPLL
jgi:hypothetical protein